MSAATEQLRPDIARRRLAPLAALSRSDLRASGAAKLARFASTAVTGLFAVAMVYVRFDGAGGEAAVAVRAMSWLSWLALLPIALAAAGDLRGIAERRGTGALARGRGYDELEAGVARASAALVEQAKAFGLPVALLALLALALSPTLTVLGERTLFVAAAVGYAAVVGTAAALAARACAALAPRHGGKLLLLLVLAPHLARAALPGIPSAPAACSWWLHRLLLLGGGE